MKQFVTLKLKTCLEFSYLHGVKCGFSDPRQLFYPKGLMQQEERSGDEAKFHQLQNLLLGEMFFCSRHCHQLVQLQQTGRSMLPCYSPLSRPCWLLRRAGARCFQAANACHRWRGHSKSEELEGRQRQDLGIEFE